MKRINNLFEPLLNKDKIIEIIKYAARGKTSKEDVRKVLDNISYYADRILYMLEHDRYVIKPTVDVYIREWEKPRTISISPFYPNRILDHICVYALKPHIRRSMYEYCVGNVDGRGISYGKKIVERNYKKCKYYVKLDIKKFYPSTSSERMYEFLTTKIKDKRFLILCKAVLAQHEWLPIGAYYSQWLSNYYLQPLDHYIKEQLKIPFYIRYVDDMLLCGNNKRQLQNACWKIKMFLKNRCDLQLKEFAYVKEVRYTPIDFLGFRFKQDAVYLRTRIFKKTNRIIKRVRSRKHISFKQASALLSYIGWFKQIKRGYLYYKNHIKSTISIGYLRTTISKYNRKEGATA